MPKILLVIIIFAAGILEAVPTNLFYRSPIQAQTYFREGIRQVKRQKYRSAIRSFRSAVQYDPNLGEAYLNLGACYERIDQFEKSKPYFEKAISVDDNNPRLVYLYGVALGRNNQRKNAVKYLEQAVYLAPKNPDYLYNLGVGYSSLTQYAHAATCFEHVTGIVSNNSAVWYNLGLAQLYLSKTNEAVAAWEKVEFDSPLSASALYYLALMAFEKHDYKTSMAKLKLSLALEPGSINAQYMKAVLFGKNGEYNQAINLLEEIYLIKQENEIEEELAALYYKWAEETAEKKEYKAALHRFRQSGRYMPGNPDVQIKTAETAFQAGRYDIAKQALVRARRTAVTKEQEESVNELRKKLSGHQK